jgi:hypothetical protein
MPVAPSVVPSQLMRLIVILQPTNDVSRNAVQQQPSSEEFSTGRAISAPGVAVSHVQAQAAYPVNYQAPASATPAEIATNLYDTIQDENRARFKGPGIRIYAVDDTRVFGDRGRILWIANNNLHVFVRRDPATGAIAFIQNGVAAPIIGGTLEERAALRVLEQVASAPKQSWNRVNTL